MSFAEFAKVEMDSRRIRLATSSWSRDEANMRNHLLPAFGYLPINQITKSAVQIWVKGLSEEKGLKPGTVKLCYGLLAELLAEAVEQRLIPKTPCRKIALPRKVKAEKKYLTIEQLPAVIEAMKQRRLELANKGKPTPDLSAAVFVAAYCSLRWGEIFGLKREHLDIQARELSVVGSLKREEKGRVEYSVGTKTDGRLGVIAIPDPLAVVLAHHLLEAPESEFVFSQLNGGPVGPSNFRQRYWLPALDRVGLEHCCFHSLKDTSATLLADLGADELLTKKRMGHKDISTTLRHYTHLSPGREKELVERMGKTFCAANMLHEEAKAVAD